MNIFDLRRIIKESVAEGFGELSEVQKGNLYDELSKARIFRFGSVDIEDIVEDPDNVQVWKNILTLGRIKYLGSGRQGSAFSLGTDHVLKLEPGAPRAAEIELELFSGGGVAGFPKVIDTGTFYTADSLLGWSIIEKVQGADEIGKDPEWRILWRAIYDGIQAIVKSEQKSMSDRKKLTKKAGVSPEQPTDATSTRPLKFVERKTSDIVKALLPMLPKDVMSSVEERYRLAPDWFSKFVDGIQSHYKLGMVDFKPDNMGIRRIRGGEGEVIFFDAASAKKRDIKSWEPK